MKPENISYGCVKVIYYGKCWSGKAEYHFFVRNSHFTSNRSLCFGALYCINCVWISPCRQLNSSTCTWRLIRSIQNHKYTSNDCSVWHFLSFILSIKFFPCNPLKRNTNVTVGLNVPFFVSTTITERVFSFTLKARKSNSVRILIMKKCSSRFIVCCIY